MNNEKETKGFFELFQDEFIKFKSGKITNKDELECWESFLKEYPDFHAGAKS